MADNSVNIDVTQPGSINVDITTGDGKKFDFQIPDDSVVELTKKSIKQFVGAKGQKGLKGQKGEKGQKGQIGSGGVIAHYGVFYSDVDQTISTINTPQIVTLNQTDQANGVSISNNQIIISEPGTYRMSVTMLVDNLSNAPQDATFWLKFNGTDYPDSAHHVTLPERKNSGIPSEQIIEFSFMTSKMPDLKAVT